MSRFYSTVCLGYDCHIHQHLKLITRMVHGEYRPKRRGRDTRQRHPGKGSQ